MRFKQTPITSEEVACSIADRVLDNLYENYEGFESWWSSREEKEQLEIEDAVVKAVKEKLDENWSEIGAKKT